MATTKTKGELQAELCELKDRMGESTGISEYGDWKLIHYLECKELGIAYDFDLEDYHKVREEYRSRIHEIEEELASLPEDDREI